MRLWDPQNSQAVCALESPLRHFESLAFAADGKMIAGSSSAGPLVVWDATQRKLRKILDEANTQEADSVTFSPDGKWLAGGSKDKNIHIFDAKDLRLVRVIADNPGRIESWHSLLTARFSFTAVGEGTPRSTSGMSSGSHALARRTSARGVRERSGMERLSQPNRVRPTRPR